MTPERRQTVLTARLVAGLLCALFASGYSPVQERLGLRPPRPQAQDLLCINHQETASELGCFNEPERPKEAFAPALRFSACWAAWRLSYVFDLGFGAS